VPSGPVQLSRCPNVNGSAVWKAREGISEGQVFQLSVLGSNLSMEFRDPTTDCDPGQQLPWVERFCEIVIGTGSQASYDLVLLRVASEQDKVGVGILIATYPRTQLEPSNVGHFPVCDYDFRVMLRMETDGLLTCARD
jgi:hypothetical protein